MNAIIVTGGARRIGKAIVRHFAKAGWDVGIHCRHSNEEAEELIHTLKAEGCTGSLVPLSADFQKSAQVKDLVPTATEKFGKPVTALVNNASLFEEDDIHSLSQESWDAHMDVNLKAPALLSQAFFKQLPDDQTGNIINIIDQRVWRLNPQFMSYTTSKSALWTLTRTMAQAMAPRIRVNAIGPGPVLASIHQSKESFADEAANVPLGTGPTPEEIARTIDFILNTPSLTGQMLALDGGQHLAWQTPDIPV
ncbi:SDR family oxidoreductase [Temperatibacter marinus]|uniref:SDR family oxidoreductase n=1 Tax=Temperatibacter marinus TaxID=1456591 RepID=A0AA52EFK7_9PROT|nr:SDR family oxidoreductase [Temperatibacter marinus]WND01632.1 SDR family oxidoreductase [Temperatibacter marinus]